MTCTNIYLLLLLGICVVSLPYVLVQIVFTFLIEPTDFYQCWKKCHADKRMERFLNAHGIHGFKSLADYIDDQATTRHSSSISYLGKSIDKLRLRIESLEQNKEESK